MESENNAAKQKYFLSFFSNVNDVKTQNFFDLTVLPWPYYTSIITLWI